jgi:hypothetical protein
MRCHPLALLPPILLLLGCARSPRADAARTDSAASAVSADGPSAGADTAGMGGEPLSAAERVVQQEFDAYNRRDLGAFLVTNAADARYVRYPDSVVVAGRDSLRARFGRLFAAAPRLHAHLDARLARGRLRHLASNRHQHAGGQDQYGNLRLPSARGEDRARLGHPLSTGPGSRPDRQSVTVKPGHYPWLDTWCPKPTVLPSRVRSALLRPRSPISAPPPSTGACPSSWRRNARVSLPLPVEQLAPSRHRGVGAAAPTSRVVPRERGHRRPIGKAVGCSRLCPRGSRGG